jgi:tRNA G18 (ribose-2'-O)-methylase SpoU
MNLGMLCRTVEAFRLEALVLRDLSMASDRTFRQGAVATHQWQPLEECPLPNLPQWIAEQKEKGYSPIALDIKPEAMPLSQMEFAQRVVLVLGRELTGVTAEVAAACDQTVTISQYGLVQSLNVQTAAALAIYAYICQWGMPHPH